MPIPRLSLSRAVAALLGGLVIVLGGCAGSDVPPTPKLTAAQVKSELAERAPGQPAELRAIEAQAGQVLIPGGDAVATLEARLAELKGKAPVVVNLWGDWCEPCKKEMSIFQRVALRLRGKVGFLGVAVNSTEAKTAAFLRDDIFVPYPSILDEDGKVNIGTGVDNLPKTFFYDRAGKRTIHVGPYETQAALVADIERYAS